MKISALWIFGEKIKPSTSCYILHLEKILPAACGPTLLITIVLWAVGLGRPLSCVREQEEAEGFRGHRVVHVND